MMIKPTKRKEEIIDKIYDITKTYPELFEQYYNTDSMELDVDNVPQKFKKTAIEYNKLRRELLSLPKTSIFIALFSATSKAHAPQNISIVLLLPCFAE